MAGVSGKKINELDAITNLTNDSVLPIVIVTNNNPESVARKVTVKQISDNVLPNQTGQNGKVLTSDGTNASWQTPAGSDVTSVNSKTGAVVLTGEDIKVSTSDNTTLDSALNNKQDGFEVITNADPTDLVPLPNKIYDFGDTAISALTITSYTKSYDESVIYFISAVSGTTITLPTGLSWVGNNAPTIESSTKYVISICNGAVISGSY